MNFGIIGFGRIARKFVQAIEATDEGKIYAIGSRSVPMDDTYLKEHSEVKVYKDYEELLNDPQVDAVYIALTHKFHKEWILRSLEHHIPVLSEKPLVLTSTDVYEIQEKVKKTNTLCTEALKTKFNTGYDHLKEDLKKIGNIQTIYANFCSDSLGLPKTSFLFDKEQGGALNDIGSYILGFILGIHEEEIDKIETERKDIEGINYYFRSKIYFKDGCIATAEGAIDREMERYAKIVGTKGEIMIPNYNRIIDYIIHWNDGTTETKSYPFKGNDMTMQIQNFMEDVENGKVQSEKHCLEDTKKILEISEMIAAH